MRYDNANAVENIPIRTSEPTVYSVTGEGPYPVFSYVNGTITPATPTLHVNDTVEVAYATPVTEDMVGAYVDAYRLATGVDHTINGTYDFVPPLDTLINPGTHAVQVTFTPANLADGTHDHDGSNFNSVSQMFRVNIANPIVNDDEAENTRRGGGAPGTMASAANGAAANAAETESSAAIDEQQFRFSLSPQQLKLKSRSKFKSNLGSDSLSRALERVEHSLDSASAIRNNGDYTVWVSGLYNQGQSKQFLGNPAASTNHYGVIAGSHYRDPSSQQLFGIAIDAGIGSSVTNSNHLQKTKYQSTQLTLYYNKTFAKLWKFNLHANAMRASSQHHRPLNLRGQQLVAKSDGITHDYSSSWELNYKHRLTQDSHLKPFIGGSYNHTIQFGYKENNVGDSNLKYHKASMNQAGLSCGLKANFGFKVDEKQTFLVIPKVSYTNFIKMGRLRQLITNINTNHQSTTITGTQGKHLLSSSLGVGLTDNEAQTSTRLTYTGNLQRYNRSHEVILDWSLKF